MEQVNRYRKLKANDNAGGSGVANLQYTLAGAQTGSAKVSGTGAVLSITAEGVTTITYFAVDKAANSETPRKFTIKIDRSPPTMSGLPSSVCTLWPLNERMVQVATVAAADALSGIASFDVRASSNEPAGPISPDTLVAGNGLQPRVIQLRAERLGSGAAGSTR